MQDISRRGFLTGFVAVAAVAAAGPALTLAAPAPVADYVLGLQGVEPGHYTFSAWVKVAGGSWRRIVTPVRVGHTGVVQLSLRSLYDVALDAEVSQAGNGYLLVQEGLQPARVGPPMPWIAVDAVPGSAVYRFGDAEARFAIIQFEQVEAAATVPVSPAGKGLRIDFTGMPATPPRRPVYASTVFTARRLPDQTLRQMTADLRDGDGGVSLEALYRMGLV